MRTYDAGTEELVWISQCVSHIYIDVVALGERPIVKTQSLWVSMRPHLVRGDNGSRMNAINHWRTGMKSVDGKDEENKNARALEPIGANDFGREGEDTTRTNRCRKSSGSPEWKGDQVQFQVHARQIQTNTGLLESSRERRHWAWEHKLHLCFIPFPKLTVPLPIE